MPTSSADLWDTIGKEFVSLVVKSPVALVTLVLVTFCGYGISFVLFDYRRTDVHRSHRFFHVFVGLGYTALVFVVANIDLISRDLTIDQITARVPFTLLVGFVVAFILILGIALWRERSAPYSKGRR